jgi:hypothetical protein
VEADGRGQRGSDRIHYWEVAAPIES